VHFYTIQAPRTITNKLNLPAGLVKAVSTERHNADRCISATTLLQGVKHIILTERHWEELTDDVSGRIRALWGQAVRLLEDREAAEKMAAELGKGGAAKMKRTANAEEFERVLFVCKARSNDRKHPFASVVTKLLPLFAVNLLSDGKGRKLIGGR
jgi:hypothetical protein